MRYPIVHKQALGCGQVYGSPVTKQASAEDFRNQELGKALKGLEEARGFVERVLTEKPALSGILGAEKAQLAVLQAMDSLRHAEGRVKALGGKL
jgi:hypothetical protein